MKATFLLAVGSLALVLGIVAYAADPPTGESPVVESNRTRLIEFLPTGSIVELSFSGDSCRVKVLSEQLVKNHLEQATELAQDYEEIKSKASGIDHATSKRELDEIQSRSHRVSSPWKVVGVGDNFVRLEPVSQLPFHENTPWCVLPESSITLIKGTN